MFKPIEGAQVLLVSKGKYRPCQLFTRANGELYAKIGGVFVRLREDGSTSDNTNRIEILELEPSKLLKDRFGKLHYEAIQEEDLQELKNKNATKLLGS